ncbi:MAG: serine/threonine protein kinase [Labilithrix sp.]|nr:serine/threonine protein kinase [Labilithrix sp.]
MAATLARSTRAAARGTDSGSSLLKVGDLLAGKYRVERILGEGGMGVVVAAHHELLDQHVAVKLLYQDVADREAQSRLLLEARACAKLQSEHVARVVDVDTGADGLPFIVMELLEGADLCQIADARGALPRWLVVDYVLQALEGLAHAHSRGIVHRDLKPSNLFLANRPDGTQIIKILDFGISKSTDPALDGPTTDRKRILQLTGGRAVLGSPPYMSPEQVRSPKTVDSRTDIWSMGIVMYELLTNSMPFGGDEMNETFAQILEKDPQPIRQIVSGVPEDLERLVMRCLAKKREDRFNDVAELARALVPFGSGTWMHSADRVAATMARIQEEAASGPRLRNAAPSGERAIIPSSPGRRHDSELHGTASTVGGAFGAMRGMGSRARLLLGLTALITMAALVVIGGVVLKRSARTSDGEPTATAALTAEPMPPEPTSAILPPPASAHAKTEGESAGAAPQASSSAAAASVQSGSSPAGGARHPSGSKPAPVRKPGPASTGLPVGLPRSRDGK